MTPGLPPGRLCLVTDRRRLAAACGGEAGDGRALLIRQARAAAAAGIGTLHLRERDLDAAALYALAAEVRGVLGASTTLLVNDRADIAAALAAGVHLRESSMAAARLRRALPALGPVWRAVHDERGVREAGPVDALVAGTVQPTASKDGAVQTLGLDGLTALVRASAVPVVAIGGLSGDDWPRLASTGVHGVAAIGAFLPGQGETIETAIARVVAAFAVDVD